VRARLGFAVIAIVVVAGIITWGLLPGAATGEKPASASPRLSASGSPSASSSPPASQYVSAPTPPQVAKMRMIFNATFTGSRLDTSLWDTCYPWITEPDVGCTNFSNPEQEWYLPSQVQVYRGALNLIAQHVPTSGLTKTGTHKEYACRSGMATTYPGFKFKYGYVQVIARIPPGAGLWPAMWLAASNLHWPPEIDLLEHWGAPTSKSGVYFHPLGGDKLRTLLPTGTVLSVGWHTFSVDWEPSHVTWYFDGRVIMSVKQNVPHQNMYFVANLAHFTSKRLHAVSCSGTLSIQSVKVWQR
jgi:beta-glucanase (GH16 family)